MGLPAWINVAGYVFGFPGTLLFGTRGVVTFVNRMIEGRSLPATPEQVLVLQTFLASRFPKSRVEVGPVGADARAHTTRNGVVVFTEELAKGPMTSFKTFELNYSPMKSCAFVWVSRAGSSFISWRSCLCRRAFG